MVNRALRLVKSCAVFRRPLAVILLAQPLFTVVVGTQIFPATQVYEVSASNNSTPFVEKSGSKFQRAFLPINKVKVNYTKS